MWQVISKTPFGKFMFSSEYVYVYQLYTLCYDCVPLGLFSSLISRQVILDACILNKI